MKKDKLLFSGNISDISIIPVFQGDAAQTIEEKDLPEILPILALRGSVLFPNAIYPITVGREKSVKLIQDAEKSGMFIGTVPQYDPNVEEPGEEDLYKFGTVARIVKTVPMPDGSFTAILQGVKRFELNQILDYWPYMKGHVTYRTDILAKENASDIKGLISALKDAAANIINATNISSREVIAALRSIDDLAFITNFIATTVETENFEGRIDLLQFDDIRERSLKLLVLLDSQLQFLKIKQELNLKVKQEMDQQQREFFLNSQLRTIQEELGMDGNDDFSTLREKAMKKKWPREIAKAFENGLSKLEKYNPNSPDYSIQYNYLDFMLELPWETYSKDNLDLNHAQKVLDADHYGLESVKDRIIEYLAVLKLKGNMKSPILCLYGPPGVGKTSLGKSIAKALGRKYIRIALGGMHDEAEIRGHRKTYVGALPGRILNGIKKAGTSNPVIVLDEIDKISSDFKGDPSSALLEALDPEQNTTFHDNYLDLDYDLSNVLFITTANSIQPIQPALLDRMEIINVTGYLAEEKLEIAKKYLVPKQLEEHGIEKSQLKISAPAIKEIIENYTHESGVRKLEKQIAKIARVTAKKIAKSETRDITIQPKHLREYLGLPSATHDKQAGNEGVGVVTGLAWTQMGGEILFVESSISNGKGVLSMTGSLGDVMKESATIAYQFIKSHTDLAKISEEDFAKKDIHVHVPEGATPKDGPSAGITLVSSMISALRGEAIKSGIAMTGEMTLRGKVLPVGGIKEKILAAKRAGVKTIVISEENRKDVEDIKDVYIKGLSFCYVSTIQDVINAIF